MTSRPRSVPATLVFMLLNALVWLGFGVIIATDLHPALPDQPLIKWVMAILSLLIAGILLALFILLRKRSQIAYLLTIGLFLIISLLTVFDEFGWADLIVLALNIIPVILLIKDQIWYLQMEPRR